MPLPDDFSPYEQLLEQLMFIHNYQVTQSFFGVEAESIATPEESLRTACYMTEDDTIDMLVLRIILYHFKLRLDLPPDIYGIPVEDYDASYKYRPVITLYFKEDRTPILIENKLTPARLEISWRLVNYTTQTITRGIAQEYATAIRGVLAEGQGYTIEKGKYKCTYQDIIHGLDLRLLVASEEEGIRVSEMVCELAQTSFNQANFQYIQNSKEFSNLPPKHEVLGKEVNDRRIRPTTQVRFRWAELKINGYGKGETLVDRTGLRKALVPLV